MAKISVIGPVRVLEQTYSDVEFVPSLQQATGDFIVYGNKRGLLYSTFIERLIAPFYKNFTIDMTYTNCTLCNMQKPLVVKNTDFIYHAKTKGRNFCKWVNNPHPVLPYFCMWRREKVSESFTTQDFPLYLLNGDSTPFFVNSVEFSYCDTPNYPSTENSMIIWLLLVKQTLLQYRELISCLSNKRYQLLTLNGCFVQCYRQLKEVAQNGVKDGFEKAVLRDVLSKLEAIHVLRFSNVYTVTAKDKINLQTRCNIWNTRILPYLREILQDVTLINDIEKIIATMSGTQVNR